MATPRTEPDAPRRCFAHLGAICVLLLSVGSLGGCMLAVAAGAGAGAGFIAASSANGDADPPADDEQAQSGHKQR